MIRLLTKFLKIVQQLLLYFFIFAFAADTINMNDFFSGASLSHGDETVILKLADSQIDGVPESDRNSNNRTPQTLQKTSKQRICDLDSSAISTKHVNFLAVNAFFFEEESKLFYNSEKINILYINFCSLLI